MRKEKIRVVVFDKEQYDGEWPPSNATDFILWFQEKLNSIPEEHRPTARVELDSHSGYEDSHFVAIKIDYARMETDEEFAWRKAQTNEREREREMAERRTLAALQAKYRTSTD